MLTTRYSLLLLEDVGEPAQTLDVPLLVNAQTFYAPTVAGGVADQTISPPLLVNDQTFYAPRVGFGLALDPPLLVNTQTFHAPTVTRGLPPGVKSRILGSTVPFWFAKIPQEDPEAPPVYAMPVYRATGGPGRFIILTGLGYRVRLWIEEHPDVPGAYVFPV